MNSLDLGNVKKRGQLQTDEYNSYSLLEFNIDNLTSLSSSEITLGRLVDELEGSLAFAYPMYERQTTSRFSVADAANQFSAC